MCWGCCSRHSWGYDPRPLELLPERDRHIVKGDAAVQSLRCSGSEVNVGTPNDWARFVMEVSQQAAYPLMVLIGFLLLLLFLDAASSRSKRRKS